MMGKFFTLLSEKIRIVYLKVPNQHPGLFDFLIKFCF